MARRGRPVPAIPTGGLIRTSALDALRTTRRPACCSARSRRPLRRQRTSTDEYRHTSWRAYDLTATANEHSRRSGYVLRPADRRRVHNVGVNSPPWSITTNITEPQGPFSVVSWTNRSRVQRVTPAAIGRVTPHSPAPVQAPLHESSRRPSPITSRHFEREVLSGWMARAGYVRVQNARGTRSTT